MVFPAKLGDEQRREASNSDMAIASGDMDAMESPSGTVCSEDPPFLRMHVTSPKKDQGPFNHVEMMNQLIARSKIMAESGMDSFSSSELDFISRYLRSTFLPRRNNLRRQWRHYHIFSATLKVLLGLLPLITSITSAIVQQYQNLNLEAGQVITQSMAKGIDENRQMSKGLTLFVSIIGAIGASSAMIDARSKPTEKSNEISGEVRKLELAWNEFIWGGVTKGSADDGRSEEGKGFTFWFDNDGRRRTPWQAFSSFAYSTNGEGTT